MGMRTLAKDALRHVRVLDGGFATELERRGVPIDGPLWSARALEEAPQAVLAVHTSYLQAGAQVLLTGSYQVSAMGFRAVDAAPAGARPAIAQQFMAHQAMIYQSMARATPETLAANALRRSVDLAAQARALHGRSGVLVAASLGPYGAALANGAEYTGQYGFASGADQHAALVAFHAERIAVLAETEADLLAFETVPSLAEAHAIVEALAHWPQVSAWVSFTCRDAEHTAHGERLQACCAALDTYAQVSAVGVNCTAPHLIQALLGQMRARTQKPLIVYPNSGEPWDAAAHRWLPRTTVATATAYGGLAQTWFAAGAQLVGGCCRTGPDEVRAVAVAAAAFCHA